MRRQRPIAGRTPARPSPAPEVEALESIPFPSDRPQKFEQAQSIRLRVPSLMYRPCSRVSFSRAIGVREAVHGLAQQNTLKSTLGRVSISSLWAVRGAATAWFVRHGSAPAISTRSRPEARQQARLPMRRENYSSHAHAAHTAMTSTTNRLDHSLSLSENAERGAAANRDSLYRGPDVVSTGAPKDVMRRSTSSCTSSEIPRERATPRRVPRVRLGGGRLSCPHQYAVQARATRPIPLACQSGPGGDEHRTAMPPHTGEAGA